MRAESLDQSEALELLELEEERHYRSARDGLIYFAETVEIPDTPPDPSEFGKAYPIHVKPADHHRLILKAFEDMLTGALPVDGIIVLAPPGSAKSVYLAVIAAWAMGRFPNFNVIGTSYSSALANVMSYRVRHIARQPIYQDIFDTTIKADNSALSLWSLENDSKMRADGILGGITGFRADLALGDDLIAGREEASSQIIRDKTWNAWNSDVATRLKPGGKLGIVMTHWDEDDPLGRILGEEWKGQSGIWVGTDKRKWFVLNLPMKAEHIDDPLGRKPGQMLWPQWFKKHEIDRLEAKGGRDWSSLYQQRPAANEGAILNRSWWREWKRRDKAGNPEPPECEFIFLAYDTALEADEENDCSAMTAWGIFRAPADDTRMGGRIVRPGVECYHAILLGAWQERVAAVDLLRKVKEHHKFWPDCDMILVEKKASGHQLIQEMKRMRWPVKEVQPRVGSAGRMQAKVPRAHAVSLVLEQGSIWYVPGALTNKVLDECAAFPYGRNDDLVDTVLYALAWFRDGYYFQVPSDFEDKQEAALNDARWYEERREMRHRRSYDGGTMEMDDTPQVDGPRGGYGRM